MRKITILAAALLAACSTSTSNDTNDIDPVADQIGDWESSIAPVGTFAVRGTAKAQSVGVGTGVTISITGATANAHHPWHVHRGVCGDNGPIVGNANDYPALHASAAGNATANASIGVALNEQDSYYVNVHNSPTDLGTIVGCGKLSND
jgi:hypothetical protein